MKFFARCMRSGHAMEVSLSSVSATNEVIRCLTSEIVDAHTHSLLLANFHCIPQSLADVTTSSFRGVNSITLANTYNYFEPEHVSDRLLERLAQSGICGVYAKGISPVNGGRFAVSTRGILAYCFHSTNAIMELLLRRPTLDMDTFERFVEVHYAADKNYRFSLYLELGESSSPFSQRMQFAYEDARDYAYPLPCYDFRTPDNARLQIKFYATGVQVLRGPADLKVHGKSFFVYL